MAKHKYIKTPEAMYELFESYKKEVKENPRKVNVFGGKDFDKRHNELERPLTYSGFCVFCYNMKITIHHYFDNPEGAYNEYREICSHIKREIRQDQIEGGMVGQYNPSITQRLNGLADKKEVTKRKERPLFGEKPKKEEE